MVIGRRNLWVWFHGLIREGLQFSFEGLLAQAVMLFLLVRLGRQQEEPGVAGTGAA
jgi:hypothetical protein